MKEDTDKIKGTVLDLAYFPFRLVGDSKNYILDTYTSEYKKCGGDGVIAGSKAVITTSLAVTSDTLTWLSSFLGQKKEEGQQFASDKYGKANSYATEKSGEVKGWIGEKSEQAKQLAYQTKEEGEKAASDAKAKADKAAKK